MAASAWTSAPAPALGFLSDERLARLAARGDQRAFSALFERHQPGLVRYCGTILRHTADAEDAAQNAMVSALRSLESGTVPMRVKPWLYKIAHNEAISLVRSRRPAEELDEATLPAVADPEEAGEVRQRLGQLMADLRALTERQREALVLRELCGMQYAEIATSLGSSEAAAQQTVFEARSALAQFGEGRAMACEGVQRAMSECDGMRLRTRRVRAHLRGCECCKAFEASLLTRRRDLGLLFPPTGVAGGFIAALGRLLGGGGEPLLAGLGLKGAAVGLAVLLGGGAVVVTSGGDRAPSGSTPLTATPVSAPAGATTPSAGPAAGATRSAPADAARPARRTGQRRRAGGPQTPRPAAAGPASAAIPGTAAANGGGSGTDGAGTTHASSGGGEDSAPGAGPVARNDGPLPTSVQVPSSPAAVVGTIEDTVAASTEAAGDAVQGTVDAATGTAGDAVETVTDTATGAVGDVTEILIGVPKLP